MQRTRVARIRKEIGSMKKLVSVIIALFIALLASVSYAETISVGGNEIVYNSQEELHAIFAAVKEHMVYEYKTILFDAEIYDATRYVVGETFPAGRYYVYPVVVSDKDTDLYPQLIWWDKGVDDDSYWESDYICAQWCRTIVLSDGMKIEFSWDDDQRGVCIAMQKLPDNPTNLMDAFD